MLPWLHLEIATANSKSVIVMLQTAVTVSPLLITCRRGHWVNAYIIHSAVTPKDPCCCAFLRCSRSKKGTKMIISREAFVCTVRREDNIYPTKRGIFAAGRVLGPWVRVFKTLIILWVTSLLTHRFVFFVWTHLEQALLPNSGSSYSSSRSLLCTLHLHYSKTSCSCHTSRRNRIIFYWLYFITRENLSKHFLR